MQVAGDDAEARGALAVREWEVREDRTGRRAGDAWHDLDRDAGLAAGDQLLTAVCEDEWVAAFEAHDGSGHAAPVGVEVGGVNVAADEAFSHGFSARAPCPGVGFRSGSANSRAVELMAVDARPLGRNRRVRAGDSRSVAEDEAAGH